jgi:hypothetical protein
MFKRKYEHATRMGDNVTDKRHPMKGPEATRKGDNVTVEHFSKRRLPGGGIEPANYGQSGRRRQRGFGGE